MACVVHRTPGLIPVEAFTVMGLSAKPGSLNPIGRFGTGLKYSIAVLVRMNIKVTLFIGQTEYVFYKVAESFRGQDYDAIRMKKRNSLLAKWTYHKLPFTTQYGRDWKLWQVFREMHANTLDEGGSTYKDETKVLQRADLNQGQTLFVIEGNEYLDEYLHMNRTFLPDGAKERTSDEHIQVIDRPSKHIYYRGMRIMDLRKEAMFTYNFLETIGLTEDRTAKYPSLLEAQIVGYMQTSGDLAFVEKAVAEPSKDSYEAEINHTTGYGSGLARVTPSRGYLAAAKESPNVTAKEVWNQSQPTVPDSVRITVILPQPDITDLEKEDLYEGIIGLFPKAKIYGADGLSLFKSKEEVPF